MFVPELTLLTGLWAPQNLLHTNYCYYEKPVQPKRIYLDVPLSSMKFIPKQVVHMTTVIEYFTVYGISD